ncbi:AAA family ATPase [Sandarakinorhabdus rubra]|uniref:AAA family ATPase n=1 Tax=Sandarakinorhabdus rubra TaxID=2672568 RepID=UPI0013DD4E0F|nr:AAA family ATPase [Sandarakinorhabdus rubra]
MTKPQPVPPEGWAVQNPEPPPPPLRAMKLGNFLKLALPPRQMLLGPIIAERSLNMIFAPRGIGKTHLVIGMAIAIATGTRFMRWHAPTPRRVLLIDGEMPAVALQERFRTALSGHESVQDAHENMSILAADSLPDGLPDLATPEGQEALAPVLEVQDLLIVDNLSTLCRSGKENEAESWGDMQAWALAQRRAGRAVLFVHHSGKTGEQRGTSRREDVLETVIKLARPTDYKESEGARFIVSYTKARSLMGSDAEPFEAWRKDGAWQSASGTSARDAQILAMAEDGMTQREIARAIKCGPATVNRVVKANKDKSA